MTCAMQLALPPRTEVNRPLVVIVCAVLAAHLALVVWMAFFSASSVPLAKTAPPRKLLVQTVELTPAPPAAPLPSLVDRIVEAPPLFIENVVPEPLPEPLPVAPKVKPEQKKVEARKPEPVKKNVQPPPKPQPAMKKDISKPSSKAPPKPKTAEVKKQIQQKPVAKTSPKSAEPAKTSESQQALEQQRVKEAAQQAERLRQKKLLAEVEERIAKIGAGHGKVEPVKSSKLTNVAIPGAIASLHIDALAEAPGSAPLSFKEAAYRDELAGRLKLLLRLPEYGDVKVKLTLERSGKVTKVVVVSAASKANGRYIEKTLPDVMFPPFGANFENETHYTFSITLSNE